MNGCRSKSTTLLATEGTFDWSATFDAKDFTNVAFPIVLGDSIDSETILVDSDSTVFAEDDFVVVFVVAWVADRAVGVVLLSALFDNVLEFGALTLFGNAVEFSFSF